MKVLVNCGKLNNGRYALIVQDGKTTKYITCRDYDPTLPEGSQWYHGAYCHSVVAFAKLILAEQYGSLMDFAKAIISDECKIGYDRMSEIATQAIWGLHCNGEDFREELEMADIELTPEEEEYFGVSDLYDEEEE